MYIMLLAEIENESECERELCLCKIVSATFFATREKNVLLVVHAFITKKHETNIHIFRTLRDSVDFKYKV